MPIRRPFAAVLTAALPCISMGLANAAETPSLSAREIRYNVQCPSPREVPCAIRKPLISGYRVLTEKISLDDQGSYWIADLSKARQRQGKNETIRILSDNGVWHLIEVKYSPAPTLASVRRKDGNGGDPASKKPAPADRQKSAEKAKPTPTVEACFERCRNTP